MLGFQFVMPVHQGRAAEHLLAKAFVQPGSVVLMNYHFTTSKAHVDLAGGKVLELCADEALNTSSSSPFKGNMDLGKLEAAIQEWGPERVAYVRMEASTNLIGGQPFSMQNLKDVKAISARHGIPLVFDGSLISENAYFIQQREPEFADWGIQEIILEMMRSVDIFYMSGRKSAAVRGGLIATTPRGVQQTASGCRSMKALPPTAGCPPRKWKPWRWAAGDGRPVGGQQFRGFHAYFRPPGGAGGAGGDPGRRPACRGRAALSTGAAVPVPGRRAGRRGVSYFRRRNGARQRFDDRDAQGNDVPADMELVRLALPQRTFTLHIEYTADRLNWLLAHQDLGWLALSEEPPKQARVSR